MAGTREGNLKVAQQMKERYGVDRYGKSIHHARNGSVGGKRGVGNFRTLKITNPEKLKEIQRKGAEASNRKQGKGKKKSDGSV